LNSFALSESAFGDISTDAQPEIRSTAATAEKEAIFIMITPRQIMG
jgi:hypothetical protein